MAKAPSDIRSLARSHTTKALNVLKGIMSERGAPHSSRVAAAVALLDRGWGKPPQSIDANIEGTVTIMVETGIRRKKKD